jgi:diamine N-acetyltransferase
MIIGDHIRFRALERDDVPIFVKWLNDPEVLRGILQHNPVSRATEENWFEGMIKHPPDEQVLGIEVKEVDSEAGQEVWKLIGTWSFETIDWRNRSAEFGIMIGDKSCWNKGYGTEAVRLLCQHGFNALNLNRIYLHVFENNPRAIRAYEKAGFIVEGRERQAEFKDGRFVDSLRMSLLRDEF